MKKLAWIQITSALTIGFLLGSGFGMWQNHQPFHPRIRSSPDQKKERILRHFATELQLTNTQKTQVKKILDSTSWQLEALRVEVRPKFQAIRSEMEKQIQALLTDRQLQQFERMEAQWEARKKRWDSEHPQAFFP